MLNNKYNYKDNIQIGLTTDEAKERISRFGENILSEKKKNKPLVIFLGQFKDIMTVILLISTVISVFLKEYTDAVTIILIVLLNSILGFIQEYRAEKTLESLKELTSPTAKCWRDAILRVIPARELVPDDVIKSMWNKYQIPTFNEKYKYNKIIHVNEKGELKYGYLADQ